VDHSRSVIRSRGDVETIRRYRDVIDPFESMSACPGTQTAPCAKHGDATYRSDDTAELAGVPPSQSPCRFSFPVPHRGIVLQRNGGRWSSCSPEMQVSIRTRRNQRATIGREPQRSDRPRMAREGVGELVCGRSPHRRGRWTCFGRWELNGHGEMARCGYGSSLDRYQAEASESNDAESGRVASLKS
jgi:hypothetical protein